MYIYIYIFLVCTLLTLLLLLFLLSYGILGTDAVMLSGETASGDYPLEAVSYMSNICLQAERVESQTDYPSLFEGLRAVASHLNTRKVPVLIYLSFDIYLYIVIFLSRLYWLKLNGLLSIFSSFLFPLSSFP